VESVPEPEVPDGFEVPDEFVESDVPDEFIVPDVPDEFVVPEVPDEFGLSILELGDVVVPVPLEVELLLPLHAVK
jgi:hypothetical protein